MLKDTPAFGGFSVNDIEAAQKFYGETLGLEVEDNGMGLQLHTAGNNPTFIYQKDDHEPASFTILNFAVDDIDEAVDKLTANGVTFEHYNNMPFTQDEKGVARGKAAGMGPDIAWFKDPAGNTLAVLAN
jgi:predicted enzyme related to lactoylglutathione lyase